jgi:predicted small metal-binding protein
MNSCIQKEQVKPEQIKRSNLHRGVHLCRDLGMDCLFETTGSTRTEIMREFIDHARSAHHMDVLTADVLYRVHKAIHK